MMGTSEKVYQQPRTYHRAHELLPKSCSQGPYPGRCSNCWTASQPQIWASRSWLDKYLSLMHLKQCKKICKEWYINHTNTVQTTLMHYWHSNDLNFVPGQPHIPFPHKSQEQTDFHLQRCTFPAQNKTNKTKKVLQNLIPISQTVILYSSNAEVWNCCQRRIASFDPVRRKTIPLCTCKPPLLCIQTGKLD